MMLTFAQYVYIIDNYELIKSFAIELCLQRIEDIKGKDHIEYEIHPWFQHDKVTFTVRWLIGESTESIFDNDIDSIEIPIAEFLDLIYVCVDDIR